MSRVILDGYVVALTTEEAIGIRKADEPNAQLTWLPRVMVSDGNTIDRGDTDIEISRQIADQKDLKY